MEAREVQRGVESELGAGAVDEFDALEVLAVFADGVGQEVAEVDEDPAGEHHADERLAVAAAVDGHGPTGAVDAAPVAHAHTCLGVGDEGVELPLDPLGVADVVGVVEGNVVAAGASEPVVARVGCTARRRGTHDLDPWVVHACHPGDGVVVAAIVDDDDLESVVGLLQQGSEGGLDGFTRVAGGHDDRYQWAACLLDGGAAARRCALGARPDEPFERRELARSLQHLVRPVRCPSCPAQDAGGRGAHQTQGRGAGISQELFGGLREFPRARQCASHPF